MDDNVLQHNSLSLHLFSHIQHDSSNGWDNGLLSWLSGKEAACDAGDTGDASSVPGQEDPLENEVAIHSSILA